MQRRLNGIANGMTSVVRGCVLERPRTDSTIPGIDLTYFEPKYIEFSPKLISDFCLQV